MSSEFTNFNNEEGWWTIYMGEAGFSKTTSLPDGNYPPVTWQLPLKAGAISSRNKILGNGSMTANGNLGYQILATLTGSGNISDALGTLIINLIAEITGNGGISAADMKAYLFAAAELIGSGDISEAQLQGIGELIALLEGEGTMDTTLTGIGELIAEIKAYGSLSPEGIRDAIWGAVAANYVATGTMGAKLNSAASGGVDYAALAEAVWDADVSGNTGTQAGKTLTDIKKKANMIPGLY